MSRKRVQTKHGKKWVDGAPRPPKSARTAKMKAKVKAPPPFMPMHGPERAPWAGLSGFLLEGFRRFLLHCFGRGLLHGAWITRQSDLVLDEGDADTLIEMAARGGLVMRGMRERYVGQLFDKRSDSQRPTRHNWLPIETPATWATVGDILGEARGHGVA